MNDTIVKSFRGHVSAEVGLLLGGVKLHSSSRFGSFKDAVRWTEVVIEENKKAGRFPVFGGISPSTLEPEIPGEK
jgi:hypothetical protein